MPWNIQTSYDLQIPKSKFLLLILESISLRDMVYFIAHYIANKFE